MTGYFVRRVPHHPRIFLPPEDQPANEPHLVRQVDLRPGRFLVNNPVTKRPDWMIPREYLDLGARLVGPLRAALYLARVDDVAEGIIYVSVWEVPNGREGTTMLTHEQLANQEVEIGDTLRIYTWIDIPLGPDDEPLEAIERVRVEVTPRRPLTDQESARLAALVPKPIPMEDP